MFYLVYLSTATDLFTEAQLDDILNVSRKNNQAVAVTGMLLYHDGAILQVLEGDQEVVERLYGRLTADPRHHSVMKILSGTAERRYFSEWSMGFKKLSGKEWNEATGYLAVHKNNLDFRPAEGVSTEMITFIRSFSRANFN